MINLLYMKEKFDHLFMKMINLQSTKTIHKTSSTKSRLRNSCKIKNLVHENSST